MRVYESVVILNPHNTEEQVRGCVAKLEEILKKFNSKIVNKVEWGRKPLGFQVAKLSEGYFLLIEFESDPSAIKDIQYSFRLADFILYSTIFVKSKGVKQQKISA